MILLLVIYYLCTRIRACVHDCTRTLAYLSEFMQVVAMEKGQFTGFLHNDRVGIECSCYFWQAIDGWSRHEKELFFLPHACQWFWLNVGT